MCEIRKWLWSLEGRAILKPCFLFNLLYNSTRMKTLYGIFVLTLFSAGLYAQNGKGPKLSAHTQKFIQEQQNKKNTLPQGFIYKKTTDGKTRISMLARISNAAVAKQQLEGLGVHIGTMAGHVWTLQVPLEKVQQLTNISGIDYIQADQPVHPHLYQARKTTRVDSVHMGYALPMAYSGKNVVVGVIDFGFDYNHPTLYDTNGHHYRVKRVWELNTSGTPPAGYTYGHEITDTSLIKLQGTDNAEQTHGTAVAGMAAGSGYGGTPNDRYRGMAYEADMVFVGVRRDTIGDQWMSGGFSDFIDGISYIFDYASTVGKPAVVNISWGSQSGPHDGSNLFNQACNSLSGPGKNHCNECR